MPEDYNSLKKRVEEYFDIAIHTYVGSKNFMSCSVCFLVEAHPIHHEEDPKE